MSTRKAVIMARGLGTRMRADDGTKLEQSQQGAADAGTKGLINVGRPFLDYVISALADAGIDQVCLVVGPEQKAFANYYDSVEKTRVTLTYAIQKEPLGTADAVAAAKDFLTEGAIVLNSDNYYPVSALQALAQQEGCATVGFDRDGLVANSNIPASRIAAFAVMDTAAGQLKNIVEKPSQAQLKQMPQAPVSMNCWRFTPQIIDACAHISPSGRGEYEIVDAVRYLLEAGTSVAVVPSKEGVLDMSSRRDIAAVGKALEHVAVRL
ncbi:nucleotidyl transferase [Winkia neuii]|uniref:nucleotidyltransferase family protein n=1 Tax=Winkia neuii TaxID=33007 RepID=UPI0007641C2B|nr:nucleotidyltransferase family protein [Winkia neuii]KWZ75285.1 nucleotidyl transferase [Winkia neuii]